MARLLLHTSVAAFGLTALLPCAIAQSVTPTNASLSPRSSTSTSPILTPEAEKDKPAQTSSPAAPRRTRAISPEAAAALAAFSPKYAPPVPKPEPKPEEVQVDMREVDKPKNGIVRLPKYIVQESKPPVFRERDIYTQKGLTDVAVHRYISDMDQALNRWTLPLFGGSKEARAMAMYAEDERLRNMSDLNDAASTAGKFDAASGDYIRKESQQTFIRTRDFGWSNTQK